MSTHRASRPLANADPMNRQRGTYKTIRYSEGYESWCEDHWVPRPNGDLLRSVVPGSRRHAPVFDVDMPAHVVSYGRGFTQISLDGPVNRVALLRRLKWLVREGHVPARFEERMRDALREQISIAGARGPVVIYLAYPARMTRSTTPSHRHLYLDTLMGFRDSVKLAKRLGFVDADFIRASRRTGFWVIRPYPA